MVLTHGHDLWFWNMVWHVLLTNGLDTWLRHMLLTQGPLCTLVSPITSVQHMRLPHSCWCWAWEPSCMHTHSYSRACTHQWLRSSLLQGVCAYGYGLSYLRLWLHACPCLRVCVVMGFFNQGCGCLPFLVTGRLRSCAFLLRLLLRACPCHRACARQWLHWPLLRPRNRSRGQLAGAQPPLGGVGSGSRRGRRRRRGRGRRVSKAPTWSKKTLGKVGGASTRVDALSCMPWTSGWDLVCREGSASTQGAVGFALMSLLSCVRESV